MTIPPAIAIPVTGIGTAAANLPPAVVVLCIIASAAPTVLGYLTGRHHMQLDDRYRRDLLAFRREILADARSLPDSEHATVLCELARAPDQSGSPPPPVSPAASDLAP
ncbi:hypothetical protein [Streptomyces sp. NPDC055210]